MESQIPLRVTTTLRGLALSRCLITEPNPPGIIGEGAITHSDIVITKWEKVKRLIQLIIRDNLDMACIT